MKKINPEIAIQLTNVSKRYEIHHDKPTLIEKLTRGRNEIFWALRDINLTIRKGERVGIVGPNGAGKTTLLKIIAGITHPTTGTVVRNGKTVSLIDLEAGFHPDLTGLQNAYLNGMLLGMSKRQIERALPAIIAFADIGQFIDVPLFTYSFGMKLRLGFSIALHSNPDILILDESLGVGDAKFKRKSQRALQKLISQHKTFILVSHWMEFVRQNCDRVIELDKGQYSGKKHYSRI